MPRNGSGVYSPDWVNAAPNTTIESAKQNAMVADLVTDANAARPITAGGTGRTTARLLDGTWRYENTADPTKLLAFDLQYMSTATTRTITMGDANVTLRPQSWELISNTTIAGAASWTATGLSAYRVLRISGYVRPATDAVTVGLRTSTNNGSSFDAGAGDYFTQTVTGVSTGLNAVSSVSTSLFLSGTTIGNATGASEEGLSFDIVLHQFNQASRMFSDGKSFGLSDAAAGVVTSFGGIRLSSTARNAIQIIFASGNIAAGNVLLEGIRG